MDRAYGNIILLLGCAFALAGEKWLAVSFWAAGVAWKSNI